jgi:riboflavin biosynthesis pyrimidine reductase
LLDELVVHIAPVLIGDGIRLFEHPGGTSVPLVTVDDRPGLTNLWMKVK